VLHFIFPSKEPQIWTPESFSTEILSHLRGRLLFFVLLLEGGIGCFVVSMVFNPSGSFLSLPGSSKPPGHPSFHYYTAALGDVLCGEEALHRASWGINPLRASEDTHNMRFQEPIFRVRRFVLPFVSSVLIHGEP